MPRFITCTSYTASSLVPSGPAGSFTTSFRSATASTIVSPWASAVMPLAQVTSQRQREVELRAALRQMRTAIDRFKDAVDQGRIAQTELSPGSEGYPPDLQTLFRAKAAYDRSRILEAAGRARA